MRRSLWMPLPLPASPYKGEGKCGSPDKGEKTAWRPHNQTLTRRGGPVKFLSASSTGLGGVLRIPFPLVPGAGEIGSGRMADQLEGKQAE